MQSRQSHKHHEAIRSCDRNIGQTWWEAPDGGRVENCQLLGEACGGDASLALANLLDENPWIVVAGLQARLDA